MIDYLYAGIVAIFMLASAYIIMWSVSVIVDSFWRFK